jgi:chaperonin GroES
VELEKKLKLDTILSTSNVAKVLLDADLETIGQYVHEGFTTDKASRSAWEEKVDDWTRLALQVAEIKTTPWPNAANVKYPLITTAALQFSARAYPALLPGTNPVRGRVIGYDDTGE